MRQKKRLGAAAVEFAIVAPVFFMVVLGIFEFGRSMMVQQSLINASREGARAAIFSDATTQKAKDAVIAHLAKTGIAILADKITVAPDPVTASNGDAITVSITIPYSDIAWVSGFYMNGTSLNASTTMRYETTD